jgi:hypothetical protein
MHELWSIQDRGPRRVARLRRARPAVLALAGFALLAAACGGGSNGPRVAQIGSGSTTTVKAASQTGSKKGVALAYSRCMRSHGIHDFPDPNSDGEIQISVDLGSGSDLGPDNPQFKVASQACKALAPSEGTPAQQAQRKAAALEYSKCMRSHGIHDFPDPNSSGGLEIQATPGGDLDPNSPQFVAAQKACAHFMSGFAKGKPSLNSHGAP